MDFNLVTISSHFTEIFFVLIVDITYLHEAVNLCQMSDDNPFVIPEMGPTLRKQIQECNWQVVNVTTPANYFHVLHRQVSYLYCMMICFLDTIM